MRPVKFELIETDESLTSHSGLALIGTLIDKSGLRYSLFDSLPAKKKGFCDSRDALIANIRKESIEEWLVESQAFGEWRTPREGKMVYVGETVRERDDVCMRVIFRVTERTIDREINGRVDRGNFPLSLSQNRA